MTDVFNVHPQTYSFYKIRRKSDGLFFVHYWEWDADGGKIYNTLKVARRVASGVHRHERKGGHPVRRRLPPDPNFCHARSKHGPRLRLPKCVRRLIGRELRQMARYKRALYPVHKVWVLQ